MNSPENTVLVLYPPNPVQATKPVAGAHCGVPKHVYDLTPMGLAVIIDPPIAGTLDPGDVIALVLNGQSVASKTVLAGEENAEHTMYIPKGLLLDGRLNYLVYTITRGSQNTGTSEPPLTLLYNSIRPGMEDRTPGDGAHSELQLILPADVLQDGIDADRARQGVQVCFAYPYCRAHDVIWLNCNGQDVKHTVTVAEAPALPSAEPTTVCLMVEEAVFVRAGDHPNFVFSYTVTDQLGNGPDTDSPWSGAVIVDVHLNDQRLVAPDIAEDPSDPNDDPDTIDLSKLGSKDLSVLVHTFAPLWQPNDTIRVTYTATPTTGPVVSHTAEAKVARVPFTYPLMVPNAKVVAGSVVRAKYELVRNGGVLATSKTATAQVSGGGGEPQPLPLPFLVKPAVSPIDPLAYPDGVTMRIEYPAALDGDKARLVVVNGEQFALTLFNSNKRVNTVLTAAFLMAHQGQEPVFRWNLNRNGNQVGKSPELTLRVLKIADGDTRLPVPTIEPADSFSVIDLNDFTHLPSVIFNNWPFRGGGYTVDINVVGIDQNGDRYVIPVATRIALNPGEELSGFSRPVSRQQLNLLEDGSSLHVETTVYFDADALRFANSKPYAIKLYRTPILSENFDSYPATVLSPGGKIVLPSMTISFLAGTGQMGITALSSIGPISGGPFNPIVNQSSGQILEMHISGSGNTQVMHIQFNWGYSRVQCYCRFAQFNNIPVEFFDKNNQLIEKKFLSKTAPPQLVEANSSENNIWSMKVTTPQMDLIAFDYFSMERK